MDNKMNNKRDFGCNICNKYYSSKSSLCNHNKKFHNINTKKCQVMSSKSQIISSKIHNSKNNIICENCNKNFNTRQAKSFHKKKCNVNTNKIENKEDEIKQLKYTINELKVQVQSILNEPSNVVPINCQLIDIITNKNRKIEELINNKIENQQIVTKTESLTLNNIVITSRSEDNYINANQLCQAGGKKFSHWYSLDITKQLINELASDAGIPASQLIDIKKGNSNEFNQGSWIHPDLAIQLAQWISPKFAIQVSKWIRELFTNGKVETKLQLANQEIKLLKNTYLKKQKREIYTIKPVIYVLTTEFHKKNRIYIIGKTTNLKQRLSSYNKTCDHEVVYYKECPNEEILNIVELSVLAKLKIYQEQANRDRFIVPVEHNISLFIDIIDECINFFPLKI
jgi:hypothetical protein